MLEQIEQHAVEKFGSKSKREQEQILSVLKRYAQGDIGLDEAYYQLLEEELIPMPQRCGMHAHIKTSAEDERKLKERIEDLLRK